MRAIQGDHVSDRIEALELHISGNAHKMSRGCEPGNETNTDLDELTELLHAGHLVELVADLVDWLVIAARENGASWADVAEQLGVTKQAAHLKFGALQHASSRVGPATKWREPKLPAVKPR